MIRRIFLIARRELLAFVTAWGFWVSLLVMPAIISASVIIPGLIERSQPTRYYAVIADDPKLDGAFEKGLVSARSDAFETAVRTAAGVRGADAETVKRALDAFHAASTPEAGLAAAGQVLGFPDVSAFQLRRFPMARVDPPAREPEALRPYLLGRATVATPEGPRPLYAAVFLRRDAQGGVAVDYWSTALTNRTLIDLTQRGMRDLMRAEALDAAGAPQEAVAHAEALQPKLTELTPQREAGKAKVTLADRVPYFMGAAMAFLLWMVIFSGASFLLTSIIEEKSSKILEALLASARYHEILVGKLLGVAGVSASLTLVWIGFAALGLNAAAHSGVPIPREVIKAILDPALLIPFTTYAVLGYLMFGAVYLAVGSLCETMQEAQTMLMPMMVVTMPPLFMLSIAINSPDAPALRIMSWIPFYTPFLMMMRLPAGVPLYEIVGTILVLAAFLVAVLMTAGGVFRAGVIGGAKAESLKRLFSRRRRVAGVQAAE
jgi:ABC-2 type transport system permease protein